MTKSVLKVMGKAVGHWERKRRRQRRICLRPKVGVSYSVWDGEELLEFAIRSIRNEVDYVNVVWQHFSWYGIPCNPDLEFFLQKLKDKGLIDEIIFFEADLTLSPNINETNKRNLGLDGACRNGCDYFLTLDVDEFFEATAFRNALDFVMENGITHSACNQVVYADVECRKSLPSDWFAPFAYKINQGERFVCNAFGEIPWKLDPSKKIPICSNSRICFIGQVVLHHFSRVRKNIDRKIENSSANQSQEKIQNCRMMAEKGKKEVAAGLVSGDYLKVPNQFGISI